MVALCNYTLTFKNSEYLCSYAECGVNFTAEVKQLWYKMCVFQPAKKKQRATVIEFFIDVARECFNIGNFNSLMAIICESNFKNIIIVNFSACIH